jgi:hypothetical protein
LKPNWKKHYRRIPDTINAKLPLLGSSVAVAVVKRIPVSDLRAGHYSHLGLSLSADDQPLFADHTLPSADTGRYSRWNLNGREIVRRDLPKVDKTFVFEVPNFGDWTKGTHDVYQTRKVYQRNIVEPKQLEISISLLGTEAGADPNFAMRFRVEEILATNASDFSTALFFNLNLLQENVGASDLYRADATDAEYTKTITLNWDILPPGTKDEVLPKLLAKAGGDTKDGLVQKLAERYDLLKQFSPIAWISGTSGFQRYFGAQFNDNLVVFENLDYGNAIYAMYENWQQLSQLTRVELLKVPNNGYARIVHRYGWQTQLASTITAALGRDGA